MDWFFLRLPFVAATVVFFVTECMLSRVVKGRKDMKRDHGTFWFVWLSWNMAALSNVVCLIAFPPEVGAWQLNIVGIALCAGAGMLRLASKRVLGKFYTMVVNISDDHRLITNGPYRFIRHPLYAGFALFFLAWPLTLPSTAGVFLGECFGGLPVLLAVLYRVRVEERALADHFAEAWRAYASSTPRLVPWIF